MATHLTLLWNEVIVTILYFTENWEGLVKKQKTKNSEYTIVEKKQLLQLQEKEAFCDVFIATFLKSEK